MRVLLLSRDFMRNGGVGTYLCDLVVALEQTGHSVQVICAEFSQSEVSQDSQPVLIRAFAGFDEFSLTPRWAQIDAILAEVRSFQPEVVIINAMDNVALEARLGEFFPTIRFAHNHLYCPSGLKYFRDSLHPCHEPIGPICLAGYLSQRCWAIRNPITAGGFFLRAQAIVRSLRQCDSIVVASRFVRDRLVENGLDGNHVHIVPYFTPLASQAVNGSQGDGRTILWVGRIIPAKGLDFLLKALTRLPGDRRLMVAGNGSDLESARAMTLELGITHRVEFLGWTNREQQLRLYGLADVVAVTSVWPEPFGIVGIEAMACGKPVVAFRGGGVSDWLDDGAPGFSVEVGDVSALAARIEMLMQSPRLREEMGQRARTRALAEFNAETHLRRLTTVFEMAIQSFRARICQA